MYKQLIDLFKNNTIFFRKKEEPRLIIYVFVVFLLKTAFFKATSYI